MPYWATDAASTALPTVIDRLGVMRWCQVNEARFEGARRVENLLRQSNKFDTTWSVVGTATVAQVGPLSGDPALVSADGQPCWLLTGNGAANSLVQVITQNGYGQVSGVLRAVPHTFSIEIYSGSATTAEITIYVSGGSTAATATVTLTAGWRRYAITGTPDGTNAYRVRVAPATSGTIYVRKAQLEDMAGEPLDANNVPPSEYVARDALSVTAQSIQVYHGAMVDGVRYFDTACGNSLSNTTHVVTELAGAAIADATLLGVLLEPPCTALTTGAETLAGWSINGTTSLTISTAAGTAPDGTNTAVRLTEDTASTSKFATFGLTLTDNKDFCVQCFAKAGTRSWLRLNPKRKDGATGACYFNVTTGTIGNVASGAKAYMWPVGNGWYFCAAVYGAGSSGSPTAQMHVGIANADNASTYTGASGTLFVWGAIAFQKEHPQSYFNPDRYSATARTGHALAYVATNLVGVNDYGMYAEMHAYYDTGIINKTDDGNTQGWYNIVGMRAKNPNADYNRFGITIRPYVDPTSGYAIWAFDRYLGEPTAALLWRANTLYEVGDYVVPADTQANNANARKVFRRVTAGTSGAAEPTWNTTLGATTDDDAIVGAWICAEPNSTDAGIYDPNDGVHPRVNVPAVSGGQRNRAGMALWARSNPPDFGGCVNGVQGAITSAPFPIDKSARGDLKTAMGEMRIGRGGTTRSNASHAIRKVQVWSQVVPSPSALIARTRP